VVLSLRENSSQGFVTGERVIDPAAVLLLFTHKRRRA
jgi:hypothetical protein